MTSLIQVTYSYWDREDEGIMLTPLLTAGVW